MKKSMSKGKINLFAILAFTLYVSCEGKSIEYIVSDDYSGPCVIFLYPSNQHSKHYDIRLDSGLARATEEIVNSDFFVKSANSNLRLPIIEIGSEKKSDSSLRSVYRLALGKQSSYCTNSDLQLISFFVGTRNQYLSWAKAYNGELEYFDSKKVNRCKYYKDGITTK